MSAVLLVKDATEGDKRRSLKRPQVRVPEQRSFIKKSKNGFVLCSNCMRREKRIEELNPRLDFTTKDFKFQFKLSVIHCRRIHNAQLMIMLPLAT